MSRAPQPQTVPAPDRFAVCLAHVLGSEGGFVNHPADPGGATNLGISLRFALAEVKATPESRRLFDLDMDGDVDVDDIRRLWPAAAAPIYRRCFWGRYRCGELRPSLDHCVFDQAVNGGGKAAATLLQRAINLLPARSGPAVVVDGLIGPNTIAAANHHMVIGPNELIRAYRTVAKDRYRRIAQANPALRVFLNGWLARADRLGTV